MTVKSHSVGNRALVNMMERWGWQRDGRKGDTIRYRSPSGTRLFVMSPHQTIGNPSDAIHAVIKATTQGDSERFWAGPTDRDIRSMTRTMLQRALDNAPTPPEVLAVASPATRAALEARNEALTTPPPPEQEQPVPPPRPNGPGTAGHNRGAAKTVLVALVKADGKHRTLDQLERETGLPRAALHSAGNHLVTLGLAERVTQGVYCATPGALNVPNAIDAPSLSYAAATAPVAPPAPLRPPVSVPEPAPVPTPPAPVADVEDTLDDVLAYLFPDGFKAQHRRAIEAWCECTRIMLREVTAG